MIILLIFLSGDYRDVQKKYFSWFSLMHWNDGIKIFLSVPKNFINKKYQSRFDDIFKKDNGANLDFDLLKELYMSLNKNNIKEFFLSSDFKKKFLENQYFRYRMVEGIYPIKINLNSLSYKNYFLYALDYEKELYSSRCLILENNINLTLFKC
tara:strand:- start:113 stop:571 length:459 start_codon:yes stop_codon:yes gene_type:complete